MNYFEQYIEILFTTFWNQTRQIWMNMSGKYLFYRCTLFQVYKFLLHNFQDRIYIKKNTEFCLFVQHLTNEQTLADSPACPFTLFRGFFYPQNRHCTPKIVGAFYMQGYKVKEKTAIVLHCTPSFKTQWAPWFSVLV